MGRFSVHLFVHPIIWPYVRSPLWASGLAGWPRGGNGRTDGRTENLPILQDFVPYRGRCPATAQLQPKNCIKQGKGTADHMMPLGDWLGLRALLRPQKTGQNMLKLTRSSFVHAQTVVRGHHGCKSFMEHPCHVNLLLCIRVACMSHL